MDGIQFVQLYVMKNAEKIDELYIRKEQGITTLPIIKQTPRKIIKTAELLFSEEEVSEVSTTITKNFYSPNVRKRESDVLKWLTIHEMIDCIERGILIKEVRFEKDEKTVHSIFYRMGYGLFTYMEKKQQLEKVKEEEAFRKWAKEKQSMPKYINEYTERLWHVLCDIESDLSSIDEKRWSFQKRLLFVDFLLAIYKMSCEKRTFDWKEIGAAYTLTAIGSRMFSDSFLHRAAEFSQSQQLHMDDVLKFFKRYNIGGGETI